MYRLFMMIYRSSKSGWCFNHLKNISQWEGYPIWKINNVWNHQQIQMDDSSSSQFVAPFLTWKITRGRRHPFPPHHPQGPMPWKTGHRPPVVSPGRNRVDFFLTEIWWKGMACLFKRTPYNTMILHGFPCSSRCFRLNFADTGRYQEKIQRLERMVTIGDWTSNQLRSIHCWKNKKVEQIGMFFTTSRTEVSLRAHLSKGAWDHVMTRKYQHLWRYHW